MKIAVLGWGSLIWDPQNLKADKVWNEDGPFLPIEFARISNNGRLTLVIRNNSRAVQVLWTLMTENELIKARLNLKDREGIPKIDRIGFVNLKDKTASSRYDGIAEVIKKWAKVKGLDAVVWTDLGGKFKDRIGKDLNPINVVDYLSNLSDGQKSLAKKYIIEAPSQIKTEFRKIIESELKWIK